MEEGGDPHGGGPAIYGDPHPRREGGGVEGSQKWTPAGAEDAEPPHPPVGGGGALYYGTWEIVAAHLGCEAIRLACRSAEGSR
jgi:hypothetical protein